MKPTVAHAIRGLAPGVVALALFVPGGAFAQPDTAVARQVFAEVNGKLPSLAETRLTVRRPGVAYDNELRAWSEGGVLRKIESVARDDSGDVVVEYYFGKGQEFVFAYTAVKGWDGPKQVTRTEQRQYFDNGKMVKWLGGREAMAVPASDPQFAAEGRARLEELAAYVPAIRAKGPPAPAAKAGPVPGTVIVAGQVKKAAGTIVRMENGDIACYLHLKDERGAGFTELGDFDLCMQEKRLVGRRVALTYQMANVQSEECQGNPDCRKSKRVPLVVGVKVLAAEPAK
jgi:hypothetical protein